MNILRNDIPKLINIHPRQRLITQRSLNNMVIEPKESLRRLLDTWILIGEASDEDGALTVGVKLGMDSALGEDNALKNSCVMMDDLGAVLSDELSVEGAAHDDVELGAARVGVRRVEAAAVEEAQRHGDAGADEGREGFAVGLHRVAAGALGDGV